MHTKVRNTIIFCLLGLTIYSCNNYYTAPAPKTVKKTGPVATAKPVAATSTQGKTSGPVSASTTGVATAAKASSISENFEFNKNNINKLAQIDDTSKIFLENLLGILYKVAEEWQIENLNGQVVSHHDNVSVLQMEIKLKNKTEFLVFFLPNLGLKILPKNSPQYFELIQSAGKTLDINSINKISISLGECSGTYSYNQKYFAHLLTTNITEGVKQKLSQLLGMDSYESIREDDLIAQISLLEDYLDKNRTIEERSFVSNEIDPRTQKVKFILKDAIYGQRAIKSGLLTFYRIILESKQELLNEIILDRLLMDNGVKEATIKKINSKYNDKVSAIAVKQEMFANIFSNKNKNQLNNMIEDMSTNCKAVCLTFATEAEAKKAVETIKNDIFSKSIIERNLKNSSYTREEYNNLARDINALSFGDTKWILKEVHNKFKNTQITETNLDSNDMTDEEIENYNKFVNRANNLSIVYCFNTKSKQGGAKPFHVYVLPPRNANLATTKLPLANELYTKRNSKCKLDDREKRIARRALSSLLIKVMVGNIGQEMMSSLSSTENIDVKYFMPINNEKVTIDMKTLLMTFLSDPNVSLILMETQNRVKGDNGPTVEPDESNPIGDESNAAGGKGWANT